MSDEQVGKSLVEVLLRITKRDDLQAEKASMQIGTIELLSAFTWGYVMASMEATPVRSLDMRWLTFQGWLVERGDTVDGDWVGPMVRLAQGDSSKAVDLVLERIQQFVREGN